MQTEKVKAPSSLVILGAGMGRPVSAIASRAVDLYRTTCTKGACLNNTENERIGAHVRLN